ncbi:ATP-binding protein [Streptomyces sp. NPDC057136]|uniref:ATP-binding protein n=1 Tax=Streptomyces sp. NPDC057136 TaxID=3346029 RepID=UPI0036349C57
MKVLLRSNPSAVHSPRLRSGRSCSWAFPAFRWQKTAGTHHQSTVRGAEFEELRHLVRAAAAGHDAAAELTGDPGSGKTGLLTLLAREARQHGVLVLRGLCVEAERGAPFRPFIEALGSLGGGSGVRATAAAGLIRTLAEPPQDPDTVEPEAGSLTRQCQFFAEIRRMIADCVAASPHGLLLLLDDFHWADACSVQLLEMLMRWPVGGGLAIAVAHRPRQAPLALRVSVRRGVELGTVEQVALGPLTLCQSAELLGVEVDEPGLERLHEGSGGNPLYLTALAAVERSADHSPGLGARDTFTARLLSEYALLSRTERLTAHAAAVLGNTFDVDAVAAVAELGTDETCRVLGALRKRDLIRSATGPDGLSFRHPLLRDCLYSEADPCWRAAAHRRALDHLSSLGAPPMERAPHVVRSGAGARPSDREVLTAAARAALPAGKVSLAAHWLTFALRLHRADHSPTAGSGNDPESCALWLTVVRALAADGDTERIRALVREILAVLADRPSAQRSAAAASLALVQAALGRVEDARVLLATALSAQDPADRTEAAALHVQTQLVGVLAGHVPQRADVEALGRHTEYADAVTTGGALALRGLSAVFAGDLHAAETAIDAGAHHLDGLEPDAPAGGAFASYLMVLGCAESAMGWYGPARAHTERALAEARLRGDLHLLPVLLNLLAYIDYQAGAMAEALDIATQARTAALAAGRTDLAALADAVTTAAWAWLGRTRTDSPRTAVPPGSAGGAPRATVVALLLAEAALADGDGATALALLLPARDARRVSEPAPILAARVYELLTAATAATGGNAEQWVERAAAAAAAVNLAEPAGHALLAHGHVQLARSLPAEAARCYDEAYGMLGDTAAGLRAKELARTARRASGGVAVDSLTELTSREREVAELAAEGLKTRDIAQRLLVSPRTVDAHLTRIYSKLGINTRAALVRMMTGPR